MRILFLSLLVFITSEITFSQNFETVKFNSVEEILNTKNDTTYIINFWSTWCKPCIEELPYFDELTSKYESEKFKIILVSMDFKSDVEGRLISFLDKKQLKSEVWWLDEAKKNDFIEKVEKEWYGEIPFTIIKKGSEEKRYWKAGQWEKDELNKKVEEIL